MERVFLGGAGNKQKLFASAQEQSEGGGKGAILFTSFTCEKNERNGKSLPAQSLAFGARENVFFRSRASFLSLHTHTRVEREEEKKCL